MSLELVNAAAAVGTFIVISATAIAALVQLRHLRAANQLNALLTHADALRSIQRDSLDFVVRELPARLRNPKFRREIEDGSPERLVHKELVVCDFYERIGSYIKNGLLSADIVLDSVSPVLAWRRLEPVISIARRKRGNTIYENFEYLMVLSNDWDRRHAEGNYPRRAPRLELSDPWLAKDRPKTAIRKKSPKAKRR
jgi:hypothetical protein